MSELVTLTQRITGIFEKLNIDVPSVETDLFEAGLLDSLSFVELLVQVEAELGVTVTLEQLEPDNFRSVTRIAAFVLSNRSLSRYAAADGL